jgi:glyoxylase-like metal-dependent hydrolase (beta-lactamase superfamily II)
MIMEDVDALGDMIGTGRTLTTIFITHGHVDHFFGSDRLIARFPGARAVTTPGIVDYINSHIEGDAQVFSSYLGDTVSRATSRPTPLKRDIIDPEGHELRVIEVGQGDIAPSAVLHIPSLDAVVAGDVAYNQIHQMLALGGPAEWDKWIASIGIRVSSRIVIAGHKKPKAPDDEAEKILNGTRSYIQDFVIQDFAEAPRSFETVEEIIGAMRSKYPDHGNLTTLVSSARAAVKPRAS